MIEPLHNITHAIFDMDGLLLDTEPIYTKVTQIVVGRYGKRFEWKTKAKMIGRNNFEAAQILIKELELPLEPQAFLEAQRPIFEELFPEAQPMPGAVALTKQLAKRGIPMALATSSSRRLFEIKTTHHQEWFRCFGTIVTGDDPEILQCKPAPDLFLSAGEKIGAPPSTTVVFEDAPSGVQAAIAASMKVVAIPDPNMDISLYQGASEILTSLNDVSLSWFAGK